MFFRPIYHPLREQRYSTFIPPVPNGSINWDLRQGEETIFRRDLRSPQFKIDVRDPPSRGTALNGMQAIKGLPKKQLRSNIKVPCNVRIEGFVKGGVIQIQVMDKDGNEDQKLQCRLKGLGFWCTGNVLTEVASRLPRLQEVGILRSLRWDKDDDFPVVDIIVSRVKPRTPIPDEWEQNYDKLIKVWNKMSLSKMIQNAIRRFTMVPKQLSRGMVIEGCHIATIDPDGVFCLSFPSGVNQRLVSIGETPKPRYNLRLRKKYATSPKMAFQYCLYKKKEHRFLAKYLDDRSFYRVDVVHYNKLSDEVKVKYVEFGNIETIPVQDIVPIAIMDPILKKVKPQLLEGKLNGISKILDMNRFFEIISTRSLQKVQVVSFAKDGSAIVPVFDCFIILDQSNPEEWTCVNQYIVDEGIAEAKKEGVIQYSALKLETIQVKDSERIIMQRLAFIYGFDYDP